ncbi:MAG: hypothetical protein ACFFHD_08190 [Promethearchaeota archaeon]
MLPKEGWMNPEVDVSLSSEAIKTNQVVFITGENNQDIAKKARKKVIKKY